MLRLLVSVCLALALSGCWVSDRNLFNGQVLSDSGFEGEYVYAFNELNPARRVTITRTGEGRLSMYQHDAVNYPAQTDQLETLELGQGYFLVAQPYEMHPYTHAYALVRMDESGNLVSYRMPCDDWIASQTGVTRDTRNRDYCAFRSFTSLEAAALAMIRRGGMQANNIYRPWSGR